MSANVKGARDLNLAPLPRNYSRRLPKGTRKFTMSVSVPEKTGIGIRQAAIDSGRTASDLVAEAIQYWLDSNYPTWDMQAEETQEPASQKAPLVGRSSPDAEPPSDLIEEEAGDIEEPEEPSEDGNV